MSTVLALLCLCGLRFWTAADEKVLTPELTSKIKEYVEKFIQCRQVVGLSLAIVKGNETWTGGFGLADKASGRPVTSSTLFNIASFTEPFTSTLLGMLMERKREYSWKTTVRKILGKDFKLADKDLTRHMTVKDVLVHRTGLANVELPFYAHIKMSRENFTRRLQYLPVTWEFREEFNYNLWMYTLVGRIAEVMGGASWEELLHQRIFQPLQMNDSRVIGYNVEVDADNFALPYVWLRNDVVLSDKEIYRMTPSEPMISIASSADDMAKWLSFLLREGVTPDGVPLLMKETLEETYKMQMALRPEYLNWRYIKKPKYPVTLSMYGYGFGWHLFYYQGYQVAFHRGICYSYITYSALIRDLDIGIYISTTALSHSALIDEVFYYIADLLLGEDPWVNSAISREYFGSCISAPDQNASKTTDDPRIVPGLVENPQLFEGTYGNRLFGDIVIYRETSGELLVNYSRISGKLRKTRETHVLMADIYGPMEFVTHSPYYMSYIKMNFTSPGEGGQYQSLLANFDYDGVADTTLYQRAVKFSDFP